MAPGAKRVFPVKYRPFPVHARGALLTAESDGVRRREDEWCFLVPWPGFFLVDASGKAFTTEFTENHGGARRFFLKHGDQGTGMNQGRAVRHHSLLRAPPWFSVSSVVKAFLEASNGMDVP